MTEHEIRRAQAVTWWVEAVEESAKHRTRDGSLKNNRRDSEYVAEHIKVQAERISTLEAELLRVRTTEHAAAHALDCVRSLVGLDLIDGEHPADTRKRICQKMLADTKGTTDG